jgi:preprotein translocase subunit SecE
MRSLFLVVLAVVGFVAYAYIGDYLIDARFDAPCGSVTCMSQ